MDKRRVTEEPEKRKRGREEKQRENEAKQKEIENRRKRREQKRSNETTYLRFVCQSHRWISIEHFPLFSTKV